MLGKKKKKIAFREVKHLNRQSFRKHLRCVEYLPDAASFAELTFDLPARSLLGAGGADALLRGSKS